LDWDEHVQWVESVLQDPARVLLIGESGGQPVGVVRFDMLGPSARISIYMAPERALEVRGADLLGAAEQWVICNRPEVREFTAKVLAENAPSHGLFQGAGFARICASAYRKRIG
jgi:RimJ/RimL family protein N-acetyltransferase